MSNVTLKQRIDRLMTIVNDELELANMAMEDNDETDDWASRYEHATEALKDLQAFKRFFQD